MGFLFRPAKMTDLDELYELSKQFVLLNLPANKKIIEKKLETSSKSFSGELKKEDGAQYIFVLVDTVTDKIVASSMILAKHGSEKEPHFSFKLLRQRRYSEHLGIGFIHHLLRLNEETNGPTEIGGLLLDSEYRSNPLKLGKLVSFSRFLFMAGEPDRFQERVLCEFAPKLSKSGKSHLWEELGRKFTGLTYEEADRLSLKTKEFIKQLFPIEDIYLSLLSPDVRLNLGKVSEKTEPAKHMLESQGFEYLNEIDPFDGGPHFGVLLKEIKIIKEAVQSDIEFSVILEGKPTHIVSMGKANKFLATYGFMKDDKVLVDQSLEKYFGTTTKALVARL